MSNHNTANATATRKAAAQKIITDFKSRQSGGAWITLSRAKVADGALDRIADPDKIAQADANLCGPAAFVRSLVSDDPEVYATAIVRLFDFGTAVLGGGGKWLHLEPSKDLRNYAIPANSTINQADWILLASIRDSENLLIDFQSISEKFFLFRWLRDFGAMSLPSDMVNWFKQVGYSEVKESANLIELKDLANLEEASALFSKGYKVCLLINSAMLDTSTQNDSSLTPDHWVMLASTVTYRKGVVTEPATQDCFRNAPGPRICVTTPAKTYVDPKVALDLRVYTWGSVVNVPSSGRLKTNSFLRNYYGYVAAKY